jgi:tRNA (cmo5U34)-methyltransferase
MSEQKYDFEFSHREEGFDNHIEKSIRGYNDLLDDVVSLGRYFIEPNTNVIDIGCSTGKLSHSMMNQNSFAQNVTYIGVELSESFEVELLKRPSEFNNSYFKYEICDIADYKIENSSFITSIFTLQFIPRKHRADIIKNIYNSLNVGGGFCFSEKILCESSRIQDMLTFSFYDYKKKNFSIEDILNKEVTLRNMLKPNTIDELLYDVKSAGFSTVEPFWQNFMFVGFIAIK